VKEFKTRQDELDPICHTYYSTKKQLLSSVGRSEEEEGEVKRKRSIL
jgi:hypothetical protein